MPAFFDRVKVAINTAGAGPVVIGAAQPNFRDFAMAGVPDGARVRYLLEDGANDEIGLGTYHAGTNTLDRSIGDPGSSSSTGALLNLSGNATLMIVASAYDLAALRNLRITAADFDMKAAEGKLDPGQPYLITDTEKLRVALAGSSYLDVDAPKVNAPVSLLQNGSLEAAGPPPIITGGGGTASIVVDTVAKKLVFTGGTAPVALYAHFDNLGLAAGRYALAYTITDSAGGARPSMFFGSQNPTGQVLSGAPGDYMLFVTLAGAGDDSWQIRWQFNGAGRNFSMAKFRVFEVLQPLLLSTQQFDEHSPDGTVIGTLSKNWAGSTITLVDNGGGRVRLNGLDVVVAADTYYNPNEPAFAITVKEELIGAYDSPKTTLFNVMINDLPSLVELAVNPNPLAGGYPYEAGYVLYQINNRREGSTLELLQDDSGLWELDSAAGTFTNTGEIDEGMGPWNLYVRETAAPGDKTDNSPRLGFVLLQP